MDGQGNVYVADAGNGRIHVLSPAGEPLRQWGLEIEPYWDVNHVAVDQMGKVYATASRARSIHQFSPTGELLAQFGEAQRAGNGRSYTAPGHFFYDARGLALDRRGNLYVGDPGNDRIQVLCASRDK